ncbi:MAG TPA: Uma2 family endonuclease [Vicinamibacteria bacterium]|nr:Uma2 family endonuclease [Vicinamibacteria bacterium]
MSTSAERKPATYEDLLAVPGDLVAEILDGELFTSPRPAFPHAHASTTLGGDISTRFHHPRGGGDNPGGWWIIFEPELHFKNDVVVPDIAGWRRERVPLLPNAPWSEIAPDWICEVVSARTEAIDRGRKLNIYAREGVNHLWLVNPLARTLEVYRLSESGWTLLRTLVNDEVVQAEPFASAAIDMSRWWLPEAPPELR